MSYLRTTQRGFSFAEVTSVLLASTTLTIMGLPMINDLSEQAKATATQELFAEALAQGRNHAVTKGESVKVCGSDDGKTCSRDSWRGGWLVQSVGRGKAASAGITISAYQIADPKQSLNVIDETQQNVQEIRFEPTGFNQSQRRVEGRICSPENKPVGDSVIVERNGRVHVTGTSSASMLSNSAPSNRISQCKQV
jgi:Tfp pilus assembly protein FimT